MIDMIYKASRATLKTGIGQTIIAFGAWTYVLILLIVALYYTLLCIIRLIFRKES